MDRKCLECGRKLKGKQVKDYCKKCRTRILRNKQFLSIAIRDFDNEFEIQEVILLGKEKGIRRIILE